MKYLLAVLICIMYVSCSPKNPVTPTIDYKNILAGSWKVTMYLKDIEQKTIRPYYWIFDKEGNLAYTDSILKTQNNQMSLIMFGKKYKVITYTDYKEIGGDYPIVLSSSGLTEKNIPYFLEIDKGWDCRFYIDKTNYRVGLRHFAILNATADSITLSPTLELNQAQIKLIKI